MPGQPTFQRFVQRIAFLHDLIIGFEHVPVLVTDQSGRQYRQTGTSFRWPTASSTNATSATRAHPCYFSDLLQAE